MEMVFLDSIYTINYNRALALEEEIRKGLKNIEFPDYNKIKKPIGIDLDIIEAEDFNLKDFNETK